MMRRIGAAIFASVCFVGSASADTDEPQPPPAPISATTYAALVEKAETGDGDADYTTLRLAYAQSPIYSPYGTESDETFQEVWKAFGKKDCAAVIAKSDEVQKDNYTIVSIHAVRGDCFELMGDTKRSARENAIAKGLAMSALKSGDGKAPETAFHVVTLNEEHLILRALDVQFTRQALISKNGHAYDLMSGTYTKTGESAAVYFLIDDILAGEIKALGLPQN